MLEITTRIIAENSLFDTVSLKITKAITEVATISKLFRSDTLAELVCIIPNIKNMGAAISRSTIATVYGSSFPVRGSFMAFFPKSFAA